LFDLKPRPLGRGFCCRCPKRAPRRSGARSWYSFTGGDQFPDPPQTSKSAALCSFQCGPTLPRPPQLAAYGYLRSCNLQAMWHGMDCGSAFPQAPIRLSPALAGLFFAEMYTVTNRQMKRRGAGFQPGHWQRACELLLAGITAAFDDAHPPPCARARRRRPLS
jgi:hypothetical protein